jgi:hypothetical protein
MQAVKHLGLLAAFISRMALPLWLPCRAGWSMSI